MPKTLFGCIQNFLIAGLLAFIVPSFISNIEISFFVPPLVIAFYIISYAKAAWLSLLCGLILDAVQLLPRFGFLGSTYLATCLLIYPLRVYFFRDAFSTLPIMTFIFSVTATLIQAVSANLFDLPAFSLNLHWLISDAFIMPLLDAAYAVTIFSLPQFLYSQYHRVKR